EEKIDDDWDFFLDNIDFGDIPNIKGVKVLQFVCKMGKSSMNKRKQLENHKLTCDDIGPSMSAGKLLTQEEAEREALTISICKRYSIRGGETCRDDIHKLQKKITMVNHSKAELMGLLRNVMWQVCVTTIIA
nr:hypothetical protein [Tanacetum cinerariifolium]